MNVGANSKIEWTDATWNPIRARNIKTGKIGWHCEHDTTGCEFCYSEGFNKRLGTGLPFKPGHRKDIEIFLDEEMLLLPLRWKRARMIFVCSMTDAFASFVKDEWLDKMFAVMALCPQHTFQVLTKRADRMQRYLSDLGPTPGANVTTRITFAADLLKGGGFTPASMRARWPLPNVWLGISAERQPEADERIPHVLATPAAVRFVSAEPLLGPIDLVGTLARWQDTRGRVCAVPLGRQLVDWVIVGGESGPKARPLHPQWARDLRDQCAAAGVAFFFKQWGAFVPSEEPASETQEDEELRNVCIVLDGHYMRRVGKKAAGRLLDGVEHNGMPELRV